VDSWRDSAWRSQRKVHNGAPLLFEEWASQIRSIWAKGATNSFELARIVCQARQNLRYGAWSRMWSSRAMPFSKRKADKLVSIGQHLGGLDENICSRLPTAWNTLYCLSLLGAATVERCVKEGAIHSGLTLREAKELLARHRGAHVSKPKRLNVGQRLDRFQEFVLGTMKEWTPAERRLVSGRLALLSGQIAAHDRSDESDHLPNTQSKRATRPVRIVTSARAEPNCRRGEALYQ